MSIADNIINGKYGNSNSKNSSIANSIIDGSYSKRVLKQRQKEREEEEERKRQQEAKTKASTQKTETLPTASSSKSTTSNLDKYNELLEKSADIMTLEKAYNKLNSTEKAKVAKQASEQENSKTVFEKLAEKSNKNTESLKSITEESIEKAQEMIKEEKKEKAKETVRSLGKIGENTFLGMRQGMEHAILYTDKVADSKLGEGLRKVIPSRATGGIEESLFEQAEDKADINSLSEEFNSRLTNVMNNDTKKINENIESIDNSALKYISELTPSVGQTIMGSAVSVLNPAAGTSYFMASAADSYYDEAKARGMNDEQAFTYGTIMGIAEGLTEKYISAGRITSLQSILEGTTVKDILKQLGLEVAENFVQEAIMPSLSEITAVTVGGKDTLNYDLSTLEGIGNLAKDSIKSGIDGGVSAILTWGVSRGVPTAVTAYNEIKTNGTVSQEILTQALTDTQKAGADVESIIKDEISIRVQEDAKNTNKNTQELQSNIDSSIENTQQTLYNNENGVDVNGNIERYIDEGRNRLYKEQEKQIKREYNWEEYNNWEQSIKTIAESDFTQSEKQSINKAKTEYNKDIVLYDESSNDNTYSGGASQNVPGKIIISRQKANEFGLDKMISHENVESDIIHNERANDILTPVIDIIKQDSSFEKQKEIFWENQNGYNIPSDSLIAKDILCDRFSEIITGEEIDYKNILDVSTNTTIDMALSNYYKQVYGKELDFSSSSFYEVEAKYNDSIAREDNRINENNRKSNNNSTELNDMLNNKDLPMQYYQYEKSDNVKVNTLKESASKYFNNSEQTKNYISMLEQIVTDKNVEIRFDSNLQTSDGKIANGSYSNGVITINPNSTRAGEFIAIHELTHAIGTNEMVKIIDNFKDSNIEFSNEMKALLNNYSSTEINEEALADVSAQLFGTQEFINNLSQSNPNIFQKIYREIKYLWHQFRGYKNQNQFVEDLYYKWTQAYNSSNELNSTTNYSTETLEDGTTYVKAENNKFIKEDGTKMTPREAYQSLIGTTIQFSDGDSAKIVNRLPNKDMYNELSKRYPSKFKNVENIKEVNGSINDNIEELLTNTTIKEANVPDFKDRHQKQGIKNFDTRTVKFYDGNNAYDIDFSIAVLEDGSKVAYAKKYIEGNQNLTQKIKTVEARSEKSSLNQQSLSKDSITPSNKDVNTTTKYSIQESENNSGSFNLQKNRFDVSGNENLANAQTLFYRTREDGLYYVQATDGSGKITYDGVFNGEKQLAKSLGEEIANKIVNTSESTNNEIYLQSDNIKSETDYMMAHRPTETGAYASNIAKGTGEWETLMPEDVYEHPEWYFDMNQEHSKESFKVLKQIKNNPNAEITIYRATTGNKINKGDWVTLSKKYAEYHNNSQFDGKGNIVELKVKAKDVQYAGDDINEFGYYPSENTKYSKNNQTWQTYLEDNFTTEGTRTNLQDILVKKADNEGSYSTKNNTNNIANSLNTIYNNVESESVANEGRNMGNNNQLSGLYEENQYSQEKQYTKNEYEQWEQSIEPITYSELTEEQKQLKNNIKRQYGKDIVFFDGQNNSNGYSAGASFNDSNRINIDIKQAEQFGITKMVYHEVLESNILYNREQYNEYIKPTIEKIINDNNFQKQKQIFWSEQTGNIPSDILIAKDIICDRYAEIKSNETMDYQNVLSQETNMTIDYAVENFENDLRKKKSSNNAPSSDNNSFGTNSNENSWSRQQAENKKQRKHYDSIIKSNYTTDEAKAIAKELMGTDTYVPESNKKQLATADERISSSGADSELNSLLARATTGGKIEAEDIAVGERLIQYYSKTGNKTKLQEAIQATAMAGTTAGQTVQAMSLLNHQTPEGQAVWLQRSVDKMNKDLKRIRGEKAEQFNLTAEMLEKVANSENAKALEENLNEVYKELGQQVTKTTAQKIDAWRYFSMLSSPKTHIRNITGNTAMAGVQGIKNKVAGTIEGVVSKFNSDMERTHTIALASKEVKSFAKADIENVADRLGLNENKYNPKTRLENSMRTFKSDAMEKTVGKAFEINNNLLEAEDGWGLKSGYVKALSEYMTANNLTPDSITDKQLGKARNYAVEQAKEATFHQDSQVASLLNQLSNKNKFYKFFLDSTLPFKKTPINVAKAGIEYSPVGLVKSAVYDTVKLRKGDITVNTYIDNISKGLTGTGIALVGYALASCGVLKASGSDDEDREGFEESRGSQNYSITIGDNTYSLDWLAPSGIPLFIGAECYELMQASSEKKTSSSDDDKIYNQAIESATNILDSFANAMNPMTEMSMLSGLTSALKSYEQGSSKVITQFGINAIRSYVNQFVPTALGQIAKTTDKYERSTTSTKTGLEKTIDSTKNQIMSKIPGLRELLPVKTDIWGEEVKQSDNILVRALENSVLPWTRKELNSTYVDKELLTVYENTGESSVFPDSINKNITINKEKYTMTSDEYAKYKQKYGKTSYNLLNSLIKSSSYKKMSDSEKQYAIEKVYSYATEQIKVDYAKQNKLDYEQSTLSQVVNAIEKANGNSSNYFEYLAKTQDLNKDSEKIKILANSNYSNKTKTVIYEKSLGKEDTKYEILNTSNIDITEYLNYKSQDFSSDKKDDGTLNGSTVSGSKKKKVWNYINNMNITYTQKLLLYGMEYTVTDSEQKLIINYIDSLDLTQKEKLEALKNFKGFTIYKDGTIKY